MYGQLRKLLVCSILLGSVINALLRSKPSIERNEQTKPAANTQNIPTGQPKKRPMNDSLLAHPIPHEEHWRNEQKRHWERQICAAISANWITKIGAAIAILALGAVAWQSNTAYQQLLLTDRTLKLSERAWVIIAGISLKEPVGVSQKAIAVAGFKISGHSPALEMSVKHQITVSPMIPMVDIPFLSKIQVGSIAVYGPDTKPLSTVEHPMTNNEFGELIAGRSHIYSYGLIEYADIFGQRHWTSFCYRTVSLAELNMVACPRGNETDKN